MQRKCNNALTNLASIIKVYIMKTRARIDPENVNESTAEIQETGYKRPKGRSYLGKTNISAKTIPAK